MRISLFDKIRAFFARDKGAYWWDHFSDEEKQLRRMDVWQLAKVINDARVRNLAGEAEKLIVAEHMLSERLARIQARPGYIAAVAGLVGVVAGAFLTSALQVPDTQPKCLCECKNGGLAQPKAAAPVQDAFSFSITPGVPEGNGLKSKEGQDGKPAGK